MSEFNYLDQLNRSLGKFVLITFSFSWLLWVPSLLSSFQLIPHSPLFNLFLIIGSFGPFFAGFLLTFLDGGTEGVKSLWSKGWHCEKKIFIVISLTLIPLLTLFSLLIASIFDGTSLNEYVNLYRYGQIFTEIFVMFFFGGPFQEEFGWRGYALNSLQPKLSAFESSLILGGIWSIWHYPLFFITGTAYSYQSFYSFTISILALSIIFTWFHNNTNGSILIAMLFHTSINSTYALFLQRITPLGSVYFMILLDITMVAILIVFGQEKLKWTKGKHKVTWKLFRKRF
jgi:membrane protease YdiL (CAAX protease family)